MAAINQQFKLTKLAKDLGLKSKDLVEILADNGIEAKSTQKALEPAEFDILFDTLTKANQISNIGDYLDGVTQIPSKAKKATPEKEEKAEPVAKEAPAKAEKALGWKRDISFNELVTRMVKNDLALVEKEVKLNAING